MQTEKGQYNELPEYDNSSEEVFFDMKSSDGGEFDQMSEDEMPITENIEEDTADNQENLKLKDKKQKSADSEADKAKNNKKDKKDKKSKENKTKEIRITDLKIRREASYDIAEFTISQPVKIMRKNQGGQLLKLRIIPPVALSDKKFKDKLNHQ